MEVLKMDVRIFFDILKPFGILIIMIAFISWFIKLKTNFLEKVLAMFKVAFYSYLIYLSLWLNVESVNDELIVSSKLAKELSLGQLLVVAISILEVGTNLYTFFKLPPSDFKYITREKYREDKLDRRHKIMDLESRIYNLEKKEQNPE